MSFTRREFLLGTGAGLLLPKTYDFFANFLAQNGEPFLEKPTDCKQVIYCSDIFGEGGLRLLLDTPEYEIPDFSSLTYEEFFQEFFPDRLLEPGFWETKGDWYPREAYIDEWTAFEMWVERHSPDVKAFELLEWVDLGETRSRRDGVDGCATRRRLGDRHHADHCTLSIASLPGLQVRGPPSCVTVEVV